MLLLLIFASFISCKPDKASLENTWLIVETEHKPNAGFLPKFEDHFLQFNSDSLFVHYPYSNYRLVHNYILEENYIKTDSFTFGKIIGLSTDSLSIDLDSNTAIIHLVPLQSIHFTNEDEMKVLRLLTQQPWTLSIKESNLNYNQYYFTAPFQHFLEEKAEANVIVHEQGFGPTQTLNSWWTLDNYDGKLVISYDWRDGITMNHIQILDYSDTTITGSINFLGSYWQGVQLKRKEVMDSIELQTIEEKINGT